MKYKIGDEVTIKEKDQLEKNAGTTTEMYEYAGRSAKIVYCNGEIYNLDVDKGFWNWDDGDFDEEKILA